MKSSANLKVVEVATDTNKSKALDAALAQIERNFGKGSIMRLGAREALDIETISTGSVKPFISSSASGPDAASNTV